MSRVDVKMIVAWLLYGQKRNWGGNKFPWFENAMDWNDLQEFNIYSSYLVHAITITWLEKRTDKGIVFTFFYIIIKFQSRCGFHLILVKHLIYNKRLFSGPFHLTTTCEYNLILTTAVNKSNFKPNHKSAFNSLWQINHIKV